MRVTTRYVNSTKAASSKKNKKKKNYKIRFKSETQDEEEAEEEEEELKEPTALDRHHTNRRDTTFTSLAHLM